MFGSLTIIKPRNDPITPADRDLLSDVAAGAGLLLRNISLNSQLEQRATEVRASRRRLIAAQDAERHRLERDLHDGAQQQVVALKVKLGIARTLAQREGADEIVTRVALLADETQHAVDALRAVAHGIYPPLLESEGLETALRAVERASPIALSVIASGLARYDRQAEETIYFCVLETIEQARMSGASGVHVTVAEAGADLVLSIDVDGRSTELDLTSVTDRIDAAGGRISIDERSGGATWITSVLPVSTTVLEWA
jgi:signal transduction histidine kinase